jgi:hypothetical protein
MRDDAIKGSERRVSDAAPAKDEGQPLQLEVASRSVRAWRPLLLLLWSVGALVVPFLLQEACLVLTADYVSIRRPYQEIADWVGLGMVVLLGLFCVSRLPLSRRARTALACIYVPLLVLALLFNGFSFGMGHVTNTFQARPVVP